MDLILEISKEEIGLIADVDQHLFVKILMRGGFVFQGDRILERTYPVVPIQLDYAPVKSQIQCFWIWAPFIRRQCLIAPFRVGIKNGWKIRVLQISPTFTLLMRTERKDCFFQNWPWNINGVRDYVKEFFFPWVTDSYLEIHWVPIIYLWRRMHWIPSKQKLIANLHLKQNIVV